MSQEKRVQQPAWGPRIQPFTGDGYLLLPWAHPEGLSPSRH